ncbi:substrate-binding and VWA domain-containing protein [Amycolatopsis sp. NPDC059657]|uniref:substrate-binding and VWA domain-containing protein n=1 Tax=Amycolatopsis sp. NPDC059657 TaxID=3346899 RepID=UPI00366ABFF9
MREDARRFGSPVVILSALLVIALLGWVGVEYLRARLANGGCESTTQVRIAAAPDIAPVLTELARNLPEQDCFHADVASAGSAETAEALAGGSSGLDVWVPESSTWLLQARDAGAWNLPESGQSVASSPVVLSLDDETARKYGWPEKAPGWQEILDGETVGVPDPNRDPVGISALLGVKELNKDDASFIAAMRKLAAPDPKVLPSSEQFALGHKRVPVYANAPSLDYPYVVLPKASEAGRAGAERFLRTLLAPDAVKAIADAGFRGAAPALPADAMYSVLQAWAGVNLSARIQVLLDVSGSMAALVPGTGRSRMDLTLEAATEGLGLFKLTTELGLWLFSTKLDGDKDYQELLPMRTIAEQVAAGGVEKLKAVRPKVGGATGLYDSILAAYQSARQNWRPGRINLVVVLTDGQNEDRDGINLDQLKRELGRLQDPRKPLPVIGIGIGPDIDATELQAVSAATGGESFTTADPRKISDVFYQALSKIMCQPPACKK